MSSTVPVDVWTAQLWTAGEAAVLDDVDPADVSYPVATDPDTAVAVAVALAAEEAPALIARDREVSGQDDAEILAVGPAAGIHKGLGVTPLDVAGAEVVTFAHILNPTGDITEEQARAAAEFAAFHDATAEVPAELPDRTAAWAAVTEDVAAEETPEAEAPETAAPADTLILLDTSAGTTAALGDRSIYAASAAALGPIARDLGTGGQQVALWNYSSPLNPGVTQGWRRNVNFSDGQQAADAVLRFGTGGVPQTRSALVAALANAADQSRATGEPARVLLVTSGTAQDMDDAAFTQAFTDAIGDADVSVDVVHVGGGEVDGVLAGLTGHTQITDPAQLESALRAAAGL
ncbi:MAG: VWA domain-containing protein [Corynebacterium marinum]|uniref:VWA domain-containing protein n=1 Tax=Corynebacterium marinum TaxID=349751 RepID=A0A847H920_9CORY|nr:VWA domain-containing protein [Corynebacterium marinum]